MSKYNPKISVIVPVYNVDRYLKQCIDSILNQTFTDFELILINDGSIDFSYKICREYAEIDGRIRLFSQENNGPGSARNLGIENARGEFIAFVDSDDYVDVKYLEKLYHTQEKYNCDVAMIAYYRYDDSTNLLHYYYKEDVDNVEILTQMEALDQMRNSAIHRQVWGKLFRKILFENIRFPEHLYFEDFHVMIKILLNVDAVVFLRENLYCYRFNPTGIVGSARSIKKIADDIISYEEVILSLSLAEKNYPSFIDNYSGVLRLYKRILEDRKLEHLPLYKNIIARLQLLPNRGNDVQELETNNIELDMNEKISILVHCRNDFSNINIDRLVNQTYPNIEIIFFTKNSQKLQNEFTFYDEDKFTVDFIKKNIQGEYIIILNDNEIFLENNSLELIYKEMKYCDSDLSVSSCARLEDGVFKFKFSGEKQKTRLITENNVWLYTRKYYEFRKISGVLFKKDLLQEWAVSEQEILSQMISAARNPIFDCHSHCVFIENEHSVENNWNIQPIPDFISIPKADSDEIIEEKLSVALSVNEKYCKHLPPIIYSIEKNCQNNVDVYILYYDATTKMLEQIYSLNTVLEKVTIILKKIPTHYYNDLEKINRIASKLPIESYFRLLLPELLPNLQKILYLDVDMLVVGDLYHLWHTSFDGNFLIASPDYPMIQNKQSWGYHFLDQESGASYINAGMLLMNLEKFRKHDIFRRFLRFVQETSEFYLLDDQDAYNLYFNGYIKLSDLSNNFVLSSLMFENFDTNKMNIIHYCGYSGPKPWNTQANLPLNQFYMVQKYRLYKREIEAKLNPVLKVAIFLTLHSTLELAIQQIESLDIQVGCNIDIFVFCQNNNLLEKLANRYCFSPVYTVIQENINNKHIADILNSSKYEYVYFLFAGNRLDNVETLSVLTQMASDNHASLLASPAKTSNDDTISFVDAEKNLINLDKMSYQDILNRQWDVFQQLQGILFQRDVLLKYMSSEVTIDNFENDIMEKIYKGEKNKFYLEIPLWIKG